MLGYGLLSRVLGVVSAPVQVADAVTRGFEAGLAEFAASWSEVSPKTLLGEVRAAESAHASVFKPSLVGRLGEDGGERSCVWEGDALVETRDKGGVVRFMGMGPVNLALPPLPEFAGEVEEFLLDFEGGAVSRVVVRLDGGRRWGLFLFDSVP